MPIKVLVISDYRETNSVRPEAELLIGLQRAGVQVTVMTFGEAPYVERFRAAGIHVIDFHPQKKIDRREADRIRAELLAGQHDVLHLFNSRAIINGLRAARGLPVKVVLYRGYTGNVHWYDPSAYLKYLHPRADAITCIAGAIEEMFARQFLLRKNKAVTIRKGHDPAWYASVKPLEREAIPTIPAQAFWLACVANNRPMKGIRYLLEAMGSLPADAAVHLLLVGRDMDAGHCGKLIAESPNRARIHLLGYREDVLELVAACDALVLPSIRGEATTKAVIEAMSLGVAPIITGIPGNRELVVDGQCGLVVPPRDPRAIAAAVLNLYHDRELCNRLGQAARQYVRDQFNIEDTIRQTKMFYEGLTGRKRPSCPPLAAPAMQRPSPSGSQSDSAR